MNYVPQFQFETPPGFRDEEYAYNFDFSNTPGLVTALPATSEIPGGVPLKLDSDAPFYLGGFFLAGVAGMLVRFKDPFGNFLSDDYVPIEEYAGSIFDPGILCPPGGIVFLYLKNPTAGGLAMPLVTIPGVKRYAEASCD
jgi:hypothetical protein